MPTPDHAVSLEEQIDQWRSYLRRRQAIHSVDVAELEDHLREQVAGLVDAGLATDEAFLVAVKRMGDLDALSREFAREHSERLWKQLVVVPSDSGEPQARGANGCHRRLLSCGGGGRGHQGAGALRDPRWTQNAGFYARNLSLFVLPLLTGYFAWKRRLDTAHSPLAGRGVRRGGRIRQRLSLRPGRLTPRRSRRCTCRSRSGWWWASRTPAAAGARWPAAWTSFDSRASSSSTTC